MRSAILGFCLGALMATGLAAQESPQMLTARGFYERAEYADALSLLAPLARTGDVHAQNMLGYMHEMGFGMAPDPHAAMWSYLQAYDGGSGQAAMNLGIVFRNGDLGRDVDFGRALAYYLQAIERGETQA